MTNTRGACFSWKARVLSQTQQQRRQAGAAAGQAGEEADEEGNMRRDERAGRAHGYFVLADPVEQALPLLVQLRIDRVAHEVRVVLALNDPPILPDAQHLTAVGKR